ncbi:MAG TPA: multiubiquitin domain-containing protein [Gemmatimonadaceae bacterium]|jgi:hypothetical protein
MATASTNGDEAAVSGRSDDDQAAGHGDEKGHGDKPKTFKFTVDGHEFQSTQEKLTGAQIKAMAGVDPTVSLFEESGPGPDRQIADATTVDLREQHHFFTMPPAKMGQ